MLSLTAVDLVEVWEQGCLSGCAARVFLLLSRVHPDMSYEKLQNLPLGVRDDMLLQLREQLFGSQLESVVSCKNCHELLEIKLGIHEFRANSKLGDYPVLEWIIGDLAVRFRVPTGGDLRDIEDCQDWKTARQRLLESCILEAHRNKEAIAPSQLTEQETEVLAERIAQADPHGELLLNGDCPGCGHRWESLLDIATFLWQELDMRVKSLLSEVHTLAWAYSWAERDILAMSARRRQIYLELLQR